MRLAPLGRLGARLIAPAPLHLPPAKVLDAVHTHKVLAIVAGDLSQQGLVDWFGGLATPLAQRGREHARGAESDYVFVVSDRKEPSPFLSAAQLELHSDLSYRKHPGTLSAMYSVVVASKGGATGFVDCAATFAAMDPALQERLRACRARHRHPEPHMNPVDEAEGGEGGVLHPVVRRHAHTNEEILFISPYFNSEIVGDADGASLLARAVEALETSPFRYEHEWAPGDLVVWDNRSTVHGRQAFEGERELWRTQARGALDSAHLGGAGCPCC